jgi:hypothetical protein
MYEELKLQITRRLLLGINCKRDIVDGVSCTFKLGVIGGWD